MALTQVDSSGIKDGTITNADLGTGVGGGAKGGGSDDIFYENGKTVTTDYTITTAKNAMSTGPITINTGISVTVPTGSVWVIL